jgi:hypothetical protein
MQLIFSSDPAGIVTLPISLLFWGYVAAYVIHILDEALLGETFVPMVRHNFWPEYEWVHFFGFNTLLMTLIIMSIILFEILGGAWIILPLISAFLLTTNGVWHLGATIITKRYSPGLLTSLLYWLLFYFLVRYSFVPGQVKGLYILISGIVGTALTVLMISSFFIMKRKFGGAETSSQPE